MTQYEVTRFDYMLRFVSEAHRPTRGIGGDNCIPTSTLVWGAHFGMLGLLRPWRMCLNDLPEHHKTRDRTIKCESLPDSAAFGVTSGTLRQGHLKHDFCPQGQCLSDPSSWLLLERGSIRCFDQCCSGSVDAVLTLAAYMLSSSFPDMDYWTMVAMWSKLCVVASLHPPTYHVPYRGSNDGAFPSGSLLPSAPDT